MKRKIIVPIHYKLMRKSTILGYNEYKHYLKGEILTPTEAIAAYCYDCMGEYIDGVSDCKSKKYCPLYNYHPYKEYSSLKFKPKRKGTYKVKEPNNGPKYPNITVKLSGKDGNVYAILGRMRNALLKHKIPTNEINAFIQEATPGDYNHALATCTKWVTII